MKRTLVLRCALIAILTVIAAQCALGQIVLNPGFEDGRSGYWNHWWQPWPWYAFTVIDGVYYYASFAEGAVNLPTGVTLPQWESIDNWNPSNGGSWAETYHLTPYVDCSGGYDQPVNVGNQFIKMNPGKYYYSGVAQTVGCLVPGKVYEVTAYGTDSAEGTPPDMRILIDPNGGTDARNAPISSPQLPVRPGGRYWIWSSTGNNRIGNWTQYKESPDPDVIGGYQIYDPVSVQFTAAGPMATIFLLMDGRNWDSSNGAGISWDQVSIREVAPPVTTIKDANAAVDGTAVTVTNAVVTAVFANGTKELPDGNAACFYIENTDRSAGIQLLSARTVNPGDVASVSGTVQTVHGQKVIHPGTIEVTGSTSVLAPVGVTNKAFGGSAVQDGVGADTLGMLVTAWGKVTGTGMGIDVNTGEMWYYFWLDDGSGVAAGTDPQPVVNSGFEDFNAEMNPQNLKTWTAIKSSDADALVRELWGCNYGMDPVGGRAFCGRTNGTGKSWAYQRVNITAGTDYTLSAHAYSKASSGQAYVRIGIDPNGGGDPNAAGVIWSTSTDTDGSWQKVSLPFTSAGSTATVFLESDDSSASATGAGQVLTGFDDVMLSTAASLRRGIRVLSNDILPSVNEYWSVTGIATSEVPPGETVPTRVLQPRDFSDGTRQQ